MRGLQTAHWSGYCESSLVVAGVTGVGELVLTRHDRNTSKAYCYPVGKSGEAVFIAPQVKHFSGHHSTVDNPAPLSVLFGNIPWPASL